MAYQKLISIIIATYNCGQKVESTLQSIFSQNRDLFEVIVLDGDSTDGTPDYLKKYENDLTFISEKDEGIYDAFNKGIDLASGKYIYFIGAGDCLKPQILEQIKEFLLSPDSPEFVYGKVFFRKHKKINGQKFTDKQFIRDCVCQQGIFYHREIFNVIGKFELRYKVFADWFLNLKCFISNQVKTQYIDYIIADYEEGGISSLIDNDMIFKKEFPLFVKKQFGFSSYIICRLFLMEPHIFNYVFYAKYKFIPEHLISNYSLPKYLASILKTYVHRYRSIKKAIKNKR